MKFILPEFEPAGKPTKVDRWYNRSARSWVVQVLDDAGNQIGDSVYVYSKREAIAEEKRLIAEVEAGEWDDV